jgi:hypothetical protein
VKEPTRTNLLKLARRAYQQCDLALDKLAAGKDDEAIKLLAMARADLDSALRLANEGGAPCSD